MCEYFSSVKRDVCDVLNDFYATSLGTVFTTLGIQQVGKVSNYLGIKNVFTDSMDKMGSALGIMGISKTISGAVSLTAEIEAASSEKKGKGYAFWSSKNLAKELEFFSDVASSVGLFMPAYAEISTLANKAFSLGYQSLKAYSSYSVLSSLHSSDKKVVNSEQTSQFTSKIQKIYCVCTQQVVSKIKSGIDNLTSPLREKVQWSIHAEHVLRLIKNVTSIALNLVALVGVFSKRVNLPPRAKIVLSTISVGCAILSSLVCSYGNVKIKEMEALCVKCEAEAKVEARKKK